MTCRPAADHGRRQKQLKIRQKIDRDMLSEKTISNHLQCPFDRKDVEQEGIGSTNLKQQSMKNMACVY